MTSDRGPVIGILFFRDVDELDAVGPWEVLKFWAEHVAPGRPRVLSIGPGGRPVRCAKGLRVVTDTTMARAPRLDVLVHPGGPGTRPRLKNDAHLEWVRRRRATTPLLASVCTGSLVYAAAGLLANRRATTHWRSLDLLTELDHTIEVQREVRFVDEGDIITSAGVSAGIDMALHLVARIDSPAAAQTVRHALQYEPGPVTA
ncbi:DJ-1/PfpI family protein [Allonocardiopsis opalescens]|uniref:DJ-1/PfpI family protein n=1 Tax=Allonocardiopsis opalescens TaxID=1144618 RepID=A0A2T0Q2N2_9ACTN|nr:DJ-1/PfpI family protein [Allonocardiopsis opalescens]PRX98057.1 DJ-1/PfpI family protein [Allonocardiopsis opalescens]